MTLAEFSLVAVLLLEREREGRAVGRVGRRAPQGWSPHQAFSRLESSIE